MSSTEFLKNLENKRRDFVNSANAIEGETTVRELLTEDQKGYLFIAHKNGPDFEVYAKRQITNLLCEQLQKEFEQVIKTFN